MKYITVNPTWNVPPSIIYNEYLPALQQDPTVLERMGLKLERDRDGSIHISQPPGEAQRARPHPLQFPEQVPGLSARHAGQAPVRAGGARLQPRLHAGAKSGSVCRDAARIALPNEHYTPEKIRSMYGRSEIDLKFPTPIPVNITYQTAFVDDAGKLQIRKDVYGRDATMLALLRNTKGRDLEAVVAHAQPSYSRPKGDIPQGVAFNDDRGGFGGGFNSGGHLSSSGCSEHRPAPPPVEDRRNAGSTGASCTICQKTI